MKKIIRKYGVGCYFIGLMVWMEIWLKIFIYQEIWSKGTFYSFLFAIPVGLMMYLISTMGTEKMNKLMSYTLMGVLTILYSSQLVYFKVFKTFYSFYSVKQGGQVLEFWKDIIKFVFENRISILILAMPFLMVLIWGGRLFSFERNTKVTVFVGLGSVLIIQLMTVGTLHIGPKAQHSAYDLYYQSRYPIASVQELGLLTTMRLDVERMLTGWVPKLDETEAKIVVQEEAIPQGSVEEEVENLSEEVIEQILPIDFEALISNSQDEKIKKMHTYFKAVTPTYQNDYTGKFEGYHFILLTAEAFSPYAVDEKLTPTLYKMVNEGYNFTNFYNPLWEVSTSDGEYVACTSLIPESGVWSFYRSGENEMPFVMGNQLNKLGYKTRAYHNHTYDYYKRHISHPNMGYEYKGLGNGLEVKKTWPESDLEMMEKTIPEYLNDSLFHTYYMTVSGHMNYTFKGNSMSYKNRDLVKDLPYSEAGKAYMACQIELDRALEYLLKELEAKGIADRTLIALSADHYPYGLEKKEIDELAGKKVEENFELYKSTFIVYTKGMTPEVIDKPCSSLDVLPTLSNLLGIEYDSRLLMGKDIFSDSEPMVIFNNKSFITDKGKYNSVTGVFEKTPRAEVNEEYIKQKIEEVKNKFYYSTEILERDYYSLIMDFIK